MGGWMSVYSQRDGGTDGRMDLDGWGGLGDGMNSEQVEADYWVGGWISNVWLTGDRTRVVWNATENSRPKS